MTTRLMPPATGATTITVHGRTYSCAVGNTVDVPDQDAIVMTANGWNAVAGGGAVGTTAQRPAVPRPGVEYHDTSLGKTIIFDGKVWRDPANGSSV